MLKQSHLPSLRHYHARPAPPVFLRTEIRIEARRPWFRWCVALLIVAAALIVIAAVLP